MSAMHRDSPGAMEALKKSSANAKRKAIANGLPVIAGKRKTWGCVQVELRPGSARINFLKQFHTDAGAADRLCRTPAWGRAD